MLLQTQQQATAKRHEADLEAADNMRMKQAAQADLKRAQAQDVQRALVMQKAHASAQQQSWREAQLQEQLHAYRERRHRMSMVPTACRVQGPGLMK